MRLFREEVFNQDELEKMLKNIPNVPRPFSIAVEGLIFDRHFRWILMERGPGCRDEIGKLEGIGGRVERNIDFREELKREILEEVGDEAQIDILRFLECRKDTVVIPNSTPAQKKHWIILSYICFLRSGKLVIQEPLKNHGYIKLSINDVEFSRLSSSTQSALQSLKNDWPEIERLLKLQLK